MRNRSQSQKKRYNIFKNNLFADNTQFKKVPYHFGLDDTVTYILDHTNQTINICHNQFKKPKPSSSKKKIFDQRRTLSEQKSCFSSIDQTSRCGSVCGDRNRNHNIFSKSNKPKFETEKDLSQIKQDEKQLKISMVKTQSLAQKITNHLQKEKGQIKKPLFFEPQKKFRLTLQERVTTLKQVSQESIGYKQQIISQVLRPDQFAVMLKKARTISKVRRSQKTYHIPTILSQYPGRIPQRQGLVYRI